MANEQNPAAVPLHDHEVAGTGRGRPSHGATPRRPVSGFAPRGTHEALQQALAAQQGFGDADGRTSPPAPTVELLPHEVSVAPFRYPKLQSERQRVVVTTGVLLLAVALGGALGYALRNVRPQVEGGDGGAPVPEGPTVQEAAPAAMTGRKDFAPAAITSHGHGRDSAEPDMVVSVDAVDALAKAERRVGSTRVTNRPPRSNAQDNAPVVVVEPQEAVVEKEAEPQLVEAPERKVPTRDEVVEGFESVRLRVAACASGRSGVAEVRATIAGSGRVTHALIAGDFQGTPEGSCMARAVRTARFPSFDSPTLKVEYPFAL